jgi:LmbE family N-acetylglucosaminyl deacetylase
MKDPQLTRRRFVTRSLAAAGPVVLSPNTLRAEGAEVQSVAPPMKVLCVGAHPDDPESGCGGTLARLAAAGHAVTVVYLTRGERGIEGKSLAEAAEIRTAEAEAACRVMGATPVFFGQIDGATEVTGEHAQRMARFFSSENPDVVFAHWPVDTHLDHQVASVLTYRAWMRNRASRLYFFEVNSGSQTQGFLPNTYLDISAVVEQKKAALFAHLSQDGEGVWREHHEIMAAWRGREAGVPAAEAFVRLNRGDRPDDLVRR